MLTKGRIKFIESLKDKKVRSEQKLFVVEGQKSVEELLSSDFQIHSLFMTKSFFNQHRKEIGRHKNVLIEIVEQGELERLGNFQSNSDALAIVKQKPQKEPILIQDDLVLALHDIRDPGNLGTIIRIADWYGVKQIYASKTTTDIYNPKTITASMGSFTRVNIFYTNLDLFFAHTPLPIFGAMLSGKNVHHVIFPKGGILLVGNESHGIPHELEKLITHKITIPKIGEAESLNAGIATAIILDNWRRTIN